MNLISKKTTYEITAAELATMLGEMIHEKGLATKGQKVTARFEVADTSDDRFGLCSNYELVKVVITVEDK